MAVVDLSLARSFEILNGYEDRLAVAVSNSPTSTVLSGDTTALEEVLVGLERDGVFCRRIKVDYASHSPQMDPLRGELLAMLDGIAPQTPTVPLYSTVTGAIVSGPALGPDYWVRNLREPVLFSGVIEKLLDDGIDTFLEVSPHPILLPAIQQCLIHFEREGMALASLRRKEDERRSLLSTVASLYAQGKSAIWDRVHVADTRAVLPTYPWQRERFWSGDRDTALTAGRRPRINVRHPLIGKRLFLAAGPSSHVWQGELRCTTFPYLKDHRVNGVIVVPATGLLEMGLEAARELLGKEASFVLEDVRFERPVVLSETEARQVQVVVTRQLPTRFEWEVFVDAPALTDDGTPRFSRCVRGRIRVRLDGEDGRTDIASIVSIQARCQSERSATDHYQLMTAAQLEYGPAFQGVESVWTGRSEALGRLKPAPRDANRYQVHPALLDSAWQVLAAARSAGRTRTMVPVSVESVRPEVSPAAAAPLWAHAIWNEDQQIESGTVRLLTEDGQLAIEAVGIGLAAIDASSSEDEPFYAVVWERQPTLPPAMDVTGRTVVVFADSTGASASLTERMAARGVRVALVVPERSPCVSGDFASSTFRIDQARSEDYDQLLSDLTRREIGLDTVVHMWSLDVSEDPGEARVRGLESALLLAQALVRGGSSSAARLCIVTRGAQCVVPGEAVSPFQAPAWGLARTIAQEHPELSCTAIDLGVDASEDEMQALADTVWQRERESEIALRDGERFVSRLAPAPHAPANVEAPCHSVADGAMTPYRAQIGERGNLSSILLRRMARRRPAAGEVEIEVVAAGMNYRDVLFSLGLLPDDASLVLGDECAGRVVATGEGVTTCAAGDDVIALARPSLGSFVITPASLVVVKPSRLDFEEAATIPVAYLTAYYSLYHLARLQQGERVLIHSATGGVGLACLRLAQEAGAAIYATAGTEEKRRLLESLGVRRTMDSHSLAFADEIREATGGEGVDVVVNSLTGEAIVRGLSILRPGGRFIELGKRDRFEGGQLPLRSLEDSRSFFLVDLNSLASKRPDFCGRILAETVRFFEERRLPPLPKEVFQVRDLGKVLHHMARARHIGKVVVRLEHGDVPVVRPADVAGLIRDDSTYVLTGGLGGIALVTSRWLVERGARSLVLIGRSEPSPEARAAIDAMTKMGARIVVERLDVADAGCVDAAFMRWARELPPVRGIVHAAGVLDDGILVQQTPDRFRRVMAPKVDGAWNLHRASVGLPLDFFLLFSSAASIFGSAGQSNYAAANQFLDALAHFRRARGLPATSINWGPWSDVGLAARPDRGGRLSASGMDSITPSRGMKALERILLDDVAQVSVIRVDWRKWRAAYPLLAEAPFFSAFAGEKPDAPGAGISHRAQLLAAATEKRLELVVACLRQHASGVLRIAEARIDVDQPLATMGIDSLMAVELKSRVERDLGVAVPLLQLVRGPSLSELAHILIASMTGDAAPVSDRARGGPPAAAAPNLLMSVLSLKDEGRS
jgi:acyl transferase domain-containing protein